MDFLVKKFVSFFVMPFPIAMALLLLALFFLFRNKIFKAKVFFSLGFVWLTVISYSPIANILLYSYEVTVPTLHTAPKDIEYIYILGAGHETNEDYPITSQVNSASLTRFTEALRLFHQLDKKPMMIVSGYAGLHDEHSHAFMQGQLALALGVDKDKIHLEEKPRDTQEEAKVAKAYIGDKPFILVTSAFHMPRALKFFWAEGLDPIPAPTNHHANVDTLYWTDVYNVNNIRLMHIAWHEMLGQLWQKIKYL